MLKFALPTLMMLLVAVPSFAQTADENATASTDNVLPASVFEDEDTDNTSMRYLQRNHKLNRDEAPANVVLTSSAVNKSVMEHNTKFRFTQEEDGHHPHFESDQSSGNFGYLQRNRKLRRGN